MTQKALSQVEARKLANAIKSNLVDLEKNLRLFHAVQGWLPLGYDSFTTWWDNELSEVPIANGLRNWAVYAMIEENTDAATGKIKHGRVPIIAHATGLAPTTISSMKTRARPRPRYQSRPDAEFVPFGIGIPHRWHRHLIRLSREYDASMADLVRPVLKTGIQERYGVDLDAPID